MSHYFSFQPSDQFFGFGLPEFSGLTMHTDPLKLVGHLPKNKLQDHILACSTVFSY